MAAQRWLVHICGWVVTSAALLLALRVMVVVAEGIQRYAPPGHEGQNILRQFYEVANRADLALQVVPQIVLFGLLFALQRTRAGAPAKGRP